MVRKEELERAELQGLPETRRKELRAIDSQHVGPAMVSDPIAPLFRICRDASQEPPRPCCVASVRLLPQALPRAMRSGCRRSRKPLVYAMARARIELATPRFSVVCSTN